MSDILLLNRVSPVCDYCDSLFDDHICGENNYKIKKLNISLNLMMIISYYVYFTSMVEWCKNC